MKDAYRERMEGLAKVVRTSASSGAWIGGNLMLVDHRTPEEQAKLMLEAGLRGIARYEAAPTDDRSSLNEKTQEELRLQEGMEHLIIEGMFRVIDDRRKDPAYLAQLSAEDRASLEDPFAGIRSALETQTQEMAAASRGWGEADPPETIQ